jgi:[methyl-Co(III) methanol-specific corrinoid protein]:coenzyme M methyltransferase
MHEMGLQFNDVLRNADDMASMSLSNFDFGFESTVLPIDLNVEAEVLGAEVRYYEEMDGNPIYPTIVRKWVSKADDVVIPQNIADQGRLPEIIQCIQTIKHRGEGRGAAGVFIPGPFTLAGQIMDMDELFIMVLKKPEKTQEIFSRLKEFLIRLRDAYVNAGADFIIIEEGGATTISPAVFRKILFPYLKEMFAEKKVPHGLSLTGSADKFLELMLECGPDGVGIDQETDIDRSLELVPENIPLFAVCGDYTMLANATPSEIEETVKTVLDKGVTGVTPPADVYPPAKPENIEAFVRAVREYGS